MLERDPAKRTQSAGDVVEELRAIRRGVDAPGDLDLFVALLHEAKQPAEDRTEGTGRYKLPDTSDRDWHQLAVSAGSTGGATRLPTPVAALGIDETAPVIDSGGSGIPQALAGASGSGLGLGLAAGSGVSQTGRPGGPPPGAGAGAAREASSASRDVSATRQAEAVPGVTRSMQVQVPKSSKSNTKLIAAGAAGGLLLLAVALGLGLGRGGGEAADGAAAPGSALVDNAAPALAPAVTGATPPPAMAPPAPAPARVAAPSSAPTPQSMPSPPRPAAAGSKPGKPAPGTAPASSPAPSAAPAPTPEPAPEPAPAAAAAAPASGGCIGFSSNPSGAEVWIDGALAGFRARSGEGVLRKFPDGSVQVGMGMGGAVLAETSVSLSGGSRYAVRCDVAGKNACTVTKRDGACE
jgi:hypothetical protein